MLAARWLRGYWNRARSRISSHSFGRFALYRNEVFYSLFENGMTGRDDRQRIRAPDGMLGIPSCHKSHEARGTFRTTKLGLCRWLLQSFAQAVFDEGAERRSIVNRPSFGCLQQFRV